MLANTNNIRHKVLCGCQMGYCFNNTYIYSESIFDNFFTISGYSRRNYIYIWVNIVNLFKNFLNNRNRITAIRLILREKNFLIFRNNSCFKGSRTGVYSYICLASVAFKFTYRQTVAFACLALNSSSSFSFSNKGLLKAKFPLPL